MKHDLKGVLQYKGRNSDYPLSTDRDKHSLECAINCIWLQSTKRETHKSMGKWKSSRMIFTGGVNSQ